MKGIVQGTKFGKWTVINAIPIHKLKTDGRKESYIAVKCECGTKKEVAAYSLKNGTSTSCGCVRRQTGENALAWQGAGEVSKTVISRCLTSVPSAPNVASINFTGFNSDNITPTYVNNLLENQSHVCSISGQPISFADDTAKIARIESDKGYIVGNVQLVHKDVYQSIQSRTIAYIRKTVKYFDKRDNTNVSDRH